MNFNNLRDELAHNSNNISNYNLHKRKCRKFIIFILVLFYITLKDEQVAAHPLKIRSVLAVYMVKL